MTIPRWSQACLLLGWVAVLSFFFAHVEIQIEGPHGWATNMPTWRVESHWLLDLFWSGRPMTGYHAWLFPFVAAVFHLPIFLSGSWSARMEARIIATIMFFWVMEDILWFILNPAFGWTKFSTANIPWHIHWWLGLPTDYWISSAIGIALFVWSYRRKTSAP